MRHSLQHDHETKSRLIARVLRELLQQETFDTIADLKVALKARLRALAIATMPADLDAALTMVASNRRLAGTPPRVLPPDRLQPVDPIVSRSQAKRVLMSLGASVPDHVACGPRAMDEKKG